MTQKSEAINMSNNENPESILNKGSEVRIKVISSQNTDLLFEPISFDFVETLSKKELFKIAIERFYENLKDSPLSHLITTIIMSLMIFILCVTTKSYLLISDQIHYLQQETPVRIYFKDSAKQDEIINLKEQLIKDKNIQSVKLKTKEDALEEFEIRMTDVASLLSGLDEINPLPNSLEISFIQTKSDLLTYQHFADKYKNLNVVDEIRYDKFLVSFVNATVTKLSYFGLPMLLVVLLAASFVIWTDSYQAVAEKRTEIEVLRLLGATQSYIKAPFITKSLVIAFLGSLLATVFTECVLKTLGYFQIFQNKLLNLDIKTEYDILKFDPIENSYNICFYAIIIVLVTGITFLSTNHCINKALKE